VTRLGIVTGLLIEARTLSNAAQTRHASGRLTHPPLIATAAGDASRAYTQACDMAAQGVSGLISCGMAGGLDPALRPGDILIAESLRSPDGTVAVPHATWRDALLDAISANPTIRSGALYGSYHAVCSLAEKQDLFTAHSLRAVDMESHGVARAAREHNLPFLIVRVVADPATMSIPKAAAAGMGPNGERRAGPVLAGLLRRPWELPAIIQLARHSRRALQALDGVAPAILETPPA
jgi:adenosylhomocysteine nucleosidase